MKILDGKTASAFYKDEIKKRVAEQAASGKRKPGLAAILVGNNGASETYVASKV
ncbi:MAG: tetrahydrofolate dehydrogenase/cyclohydrolase catalytic domain-containing protein, partial [Ferruginibacter sp.]